MSGRSDAALAFWLALLLFAVYLLSFSGQIYSADGLSMFSVTESLVKRGEFNTDQLWTLFKARNEIAADGESYAKYGYGPSLFGAPLYALALAVPGLGLVQTTLLTSAVAIALAGALLYLSARRLAFSQGVALGTALLFGLATPAWVYAKQLWSEPYGLVTLLAAFYFLLRFRQEGRGIAALAGGLALGLAMATRVTNAALVPVFALYGFCGAWNDRQARRGLVLFLAALAGMAATIAWYDAVRYGSPFATGYRADETFDNPLFLGIYGLLFSPGKGLFVYAPFLAVLPFSFALFFRRWRREALLIAAVFVFYVVLFSAWYYWWGGTNWSPRFLVPTLPFLVLATAPALELIAQGARANARAYRILLAVFVVLCAASVVVELLGISIPSLAYRTRMVRISPNPEADAIFLPSFSPLLGTWGLLRLRGLDFAWVRLVGSGAEVDWPIVAALFGLVLFCGAMLLESWRGRRVRRAMMIALVLAAGLSLLSLERYQEDIRFGGGDGYRALLQQVERQASDKDVLILDDDAVVPFFLNENRTRLRWYGLSRAPGQWDDATRTLLSRLVRAYPRVWFAFDDSNPQLEDPTRAWLDQSSNKVGQHDFAQGVHLVLYTGEKRPEGTPLQ